MTNTTLRDSIQRYLPALLVPLSVLAANEAAAAAAFTMTQIPGGSFASPYSAMNASGQIVGAVTTNESGSFEAVRTGSNGDLAAGGRMGTFAGDTLSAAYGINDGGQVVGASMNAARVAHAFRADGGSGVASAVYLGVLPGTTSDFAVCINASGQVAGIGYNSSNSARAFRTTPNGSISASSDLGFLPGRTTSEARGINASGQVVGFCNGGTSFMSQAFRTAPNGVLGTAAADLGTFPGGGASFAYAINNAGIVAGSAVTASGVSHVYRTTATGTIATAADLGNLGTYLADPIAINSVGQIVGHSYTTNLEEHAFFADVQGQIQDLNNLIPAGTGWTLTSAEGINDRGQIVANARNAFAGTATFLLTPVPEPASPGLIGLGAAGLLCRRRR